MSGPTEPPRDSRPGFAGLWTYLVACETTHLSRQDPELVERLAQMHDADAAIALTRGSGLGVRHVRALEAGVAYEVASRKLAQTVGLARRYGGQHPSGRDVRLASVLLDSVCIYLSALIDAARRLGEASLGTTREDNAARAQRDSVRTWAKSRKKKLSTAREPVAHAETRYIEAIDENSLWEGLILVGAADLEAIEALSLEYQRGNDLSFVGRFGALQRVAIQVLAEADAMLGGIATFLTSRAT